MPVPLSFPTAYLRFVPPVRAKCRRLLGSSPEVEDIVQETFLRLWTLGPEVEPDTDARTIVAWLYRTCTRLSIDALRRQRRGPAGLLEDAGDTAVPCAISLEDMIGARWLVQSVCDRVATEDLEAAVLCRVDGLSQPEAASALGISERTIRRRLDRFDSFTAAFRKEHAA